jgi:polycystin 1L2
VSHDNSGSGSSASWYLKFIVVHDLQTREKVYFICNKWLALDVDDCSISRLLSASGNAQKNEFKYLFEKQTKEKLSDGHLWFSIFGRPPHSSFTRKDRLTCCFVLLFISMLMNIMYYDVQKNGPDVNGLEIGPIKITPEQVKFNFLI